MVEMQTLLELLMERDKLTLEQACDLIRDATNDLHDRLAKKQDCSTICKEWFETEEDRLLEII